MQTNLDSAAWKTILGGRETIVKCLDCGPNYDVDWLGLPGVISLANVNNRLRQLGPIDDLAEALLSYPTVKFIVFLWRFR